MDIRKLKVGDRIEFRAQCCYTNAKAIRKVVKIDLHNGLVDVHYQSWSNFVLLACEIIRKIET